MMKIGFVTSWLSYRSGGLHEAVARLARSLQDDPHCRIKVFGLADGQSQDPAGHWGADVASIRTHGPGSFAYAPRMASALRAADLDLVHVHGLWMHYSVASLRWRRATGRPCVISPHGMLDRWALRNSGWKKRVALYAYERASLETASCLHALCDAEAEAMRCLGLQNPICVIPNGLQDATEERGVPPPWHERIPATANVLLYLGRLHAKKGLANLIRAWHGLQGERREDWHLAIAGWDQGGHEGELRQLIEQMGVERVHFLGPLFGAAKQAAYAGAQAFILPSLSEGLPMVVLEAWSHGLPVVMTRACNLPEGFTAGAAIEVGTGFREICSGLERLMQMPEEERRNVGDSGRRLVRERFLQARCSRLMSSVYAWLLQRAPRPDCVLPGTDSSLNDEFLVRGGGRDTSQSKVRLNASR